MKPRTQVVLLATLMSATAWGQEVSLYGTTMAQMWKQETPGFDKATFTPATQYLGIDATKLGMDNLSLHLFGWGRTDLRDASNFDGSKSGGYLNYGYLQYRFDQANAEIKAGRFTTNQATGFEQVDGVSVRTDLRGGFTLSAFGGKPVYYKTVDPRNQSDYEYQRDFIFGTRLGWRVAQTAEVGVSYLQDGSKAAKDLDIPSPTDYTRKMLGADVHFGAGSLLDFRGRTVFNVANERTNLAEHDYTATVKLGSQVTMTGNYAERDFVNYFAGTNLPSLFRQDENDLFRGFGGSITWNAPTGVQLVADYRHMHRETFGDVNRAGGEFRWSTSERTFLGGIGAHWVNAANTKFVDPATPYRSLSHKEARIWGMVNRGKLSASLDGILQRYENDNPYLVGIRNLYEVVGSLGYQATSNVKVSGDVSYGSTAVAKHETRGLLRAEYRFGFAKKGGR
ncbi:hypothetical protein [Geothrix sp. SG200]|uniref:hypothetical protein n=1 Tax=Geothrix sp. SG200 TaxID=2922865 RepID=UPI001FAD87BC|nr:hypothetical protein [Geothrix sp. SG200]